MRETYFPKDCEEKKKVHLHGHTIIELRDVITGKVEKIEHDNAFTDGIESVMRDFGMFQNSLFNNSDTRGTELWKYLLGGLLLFDTALPTSPAAKYMPAGVNMTANGSFEVVNNANPLELGSYNSLESTYTKDQIQMVYDFTTSQGNGTIASVALTTATGGFIGYGNKNGLTVGYNNYKPFTERQAATVCEDYRNNLILYNNNFFYRPQSISYDGGTTQIVIDRGIAQTEKIDIFERANNFVAYDTVTFSLSNALSGTYYIEVLGGKDYSTFFALIPNFEVSANNSFRFYLLDVSTGNVTETVVTNNTGHTMPARCFYPVGIDRAIIQTNDNYKCYLVNTSTSAVIGEAIGSRGAYTQGQFKFITDTLIAAGTNNNGYETIYDPVLNIFKYTNGYLTKENRSDYNLVLNYMYCAPLDATIFHRTGYRANEAAFLLMKNPLRLMTINNLATPVTKTASKTMKVTYTITRAS